MEERNLRKTMTGVVTSDKMDKIFNPEVDKLLDFARTSTNQAERMEAYKKVQEIVQEDLPIITLVNQSQNVATQKDIENFTINPTGFYELYNVNFSENK